MTSQTGAQRADDGADSSQAIGRGDVEMTLAARTDACILVSGAPDAARDLAYRLHLASGWRHGPFTVIDCASDPARVERAIAEELFPTEPVRNGVLHLRLVQAGTVLLQEVNHLPIEVQIRLAQRLTELHGQPFPGKSRRRLMATTSEPLTDRIAAGTFDDRLFYRLNTVHLAAPELESACRAVL